jgi:hypothetical protein
MICPIITKALLCYKAFLHKSKDNSSMKIILITTMLMVLITGCTSAPISRNLSSGAIGCPANQILISNETATAIGGMHNWTATCNGKSYICSYQGTTGVNCSSSSDSDQNNIERVGGL